MIVNSKSSVLHVLLIAIGMTLLGCSTDRLISKKVSKEFANSPVTQKYFVGFELYDVDEKKTIYEQNSRKYFSPASNTKLFTLFASLKMLPEKLPSLKYIERNDSLIFWGTGNPAFLHTTIKDNSALEFLAKSDKKIFFAPGRYTGKRFASGWAWDDYAYYYGPEINEFPIAENMIKAKYNANNGFSIDINQFKDSFVKDTLNTKGSFFINRADESNDFKYPNVEIKPGYNQQIPYRTSHLLTTKILSDTLKKEVGIVNMKMPTDVKVVYGANRDTVLKHMMLPSDNFAAEHLMLLCADVLGEELNVNKAIDFVLKNHMSFLPDYPNWADGSGLSRKNLFTPRDIVVLLDTMYNQIKPTERLLDMMPQGGKSGTLRNAYPKTNDPFVFGKTGSLFGVHNQSGYVKTKKGKTYIFSFMNNNYVIQTSEVRAEMVRIMTYIHNNF